MKFLKAVVLLTIFSLAANSCEKEVLLPESSANFELRTTIYNDDGNIKNKKRAGGRRVYLIDVNDPTNAVGSINVQAFPTNGVMPTTTLYTPELIGESAGKKTFRFTDQFFEGAPEGLPFRHEVSVFGMDGESLGSFIDWNTVQETELFEVKSLTIEQAGPFADLKIRSRILARDVETVTEVRLRFVQINDEGPIEIDTSSEGFVNLRKAVNDRRGDDLILDEWIICYDEAETIETLLGSERKIGVYLEYYNSLYEIVENDLFVVPIEETGEDAISIKNTSHKINRFGKHLLSVTLDGFSATTVSYAEWVDLDGGGRVRLDADGTIDFKFGSDPTLIEDYIVGQTYETPIELYDESGELITTLTAGFEVTGSAVSAPSRLDPLFDELAAGESDSFTLRYVWDLDGDGQFDDGNEIRAMLTPQDGGSETETEDVLFSLKSTENTRLIFEATVPFIEPDNVVDQEYLIRYSYQDSEGSELAFRTRTRSAQETPSPIVRTCMSNGEAPNKYNYAVSSNDPSVGASDFVYVFFTDDTGASLTPTSFYTLFRTGELDGFVTFLGTDLMFKDLSSVNEGAKISFSLSEDGTPAKSIRFIDSENIHLLGFFDEESGDWVCEDSCLEEDGSEYCGETDHF